MIEYKKLLEVQKAKTSLVFITFQSSIVEEDWKLSQERKISRKCLDTIFWKGKRTKRSRIGNHILALVKLLIWQETW